MLSKQKKEQKRTVRKYQTQISQERNVNEQLVEKVKEQIDEKVKHLVDDHENLFRIIIDGRSLLIYSLKFIYICSSESKTLKKGYDRFRILSMAVKVDLEPDAQHEPRLLKQQCHHQVSKCLFHRLQQLWIKSCHT